MFRFDREDTKILVSNALHLLDKFIYHNRAVMAYDEVGFCIILRRK